MYMGMVRHRRSPGMQDRGDADAGAEMLWIGGNGQECLSRSLEQQIMDRRLVLIRDVRDRGRRCEDDVEILDRQQVLHARQHPVPRRGTLALGAMPPLGVVLRKRLSGNGLRQEL